MSWVLASLSLSACTASSSAGREFETPASPDRLWSLIGRISLLGSFHSELQRTWKNFNEFTIPFVLSASRRRMVKIFNRIPIAWMPLKEKSTSVLWGHQISSRSFYWWANDGDWTRAWWIHNPLPWSTWLHPPLPPRTGFSLYLRSDPFRTLPMTAIKELLFPIVAHSLLCFLLGSLQSFQKWGWAVHFIDLSPLYLRAAEERIGLDQRFSRLRASSKRRKKAEQTEEQARSKKT